MIEIPDLFAPYALPIALIAIANILLSPSSSLLTIACASVVLWHWIYWIHRFHHSLPSTGIWAYINTHVSVHHDKQFNLSRSTELLIETLENSLWFVALYAIQEILDIHLVPLTILLFAMLVYTSTHIVNYSMIGSEKHRLHHRYHTLNYGPDILDHSFGTNSDDSLEDMNHTIPNILASFGILYAMQSYSLI
jgi:hypothetical protein